VIDVRDDGDVANVAALLHVPTLARIFRGTDLAPAFARGA
jgi:hypothetical protein